MESKIKSSLKVPLFKPTIQEFEHFAEYIAKLEKKNISFAKVSFVYQFLQSGDSFGQTKKIQEIYHIRIEVCCASKLLIFTLKLVLLNMHEQQQYRCTANNVI